MRYYQIDATMKLNVCASSYDEARQTVIDGLDTGRYDASCFKIEIVGPKECDE